MAANPIAGFLHDLLAAIPAPPPPPGAAWFRPNNNPHHHHPKHKTKQLTKTHTRTVHRYRTALRTHTATRAVTKTVIHTAVVPRTRKVYRNVYETQVKNKTRWATRRVTATKTVERRAVTEWVTKRVTRTRTVEEVVTATSTRTVTETAAVTETVPAVVMGISDGGSVPKISAGDQGEVGMMGMGGMGAWVGLLLLFLTLLGVWNMRTAGGNRRVRGTMEKVQGWTERGLEIICEEVEVMVRATSARYELYRQMQEEMKNERVIGEKNEGKGGEEEKSTAAAVEEKSMRGGMPETVIPSQSEKADITDDDINGVGKTHFIGVAAGMKEKERRGSGNISTSEEEDGVMVYTPTGSEDEAE